MTPISGSKLLLHVYEEQTLEKHHRSTVPQNTYSIILFDMLEKYVQNTANLTANITILYVIFTDYNQTQILKSSTVFVQQLSVSGSACGCEVGGYKAHTYRIINSNKLL